MQVEISSVAAHPFQNMVGQVDLFSRELVIKSSKGPVYALLLQFRRRNDD